MFDQRIAAEAVDERHRAWSVKTGSVGAVKTTPARKDCEASGRITWRVVLEIRRHGVPVGSTDDLVEADIPAEAERIAIEGWMAKRPDVSFHPLVATVTTGEEGLR